MNSITVSRSHRICRIRLTRTAKRNALGEMEWAELARLFSSLAGDRDIDIIVLEAAGGVFCAGVDLDMIETARAHERGIPAMFERTGRVFQDFETLPQITVVVLNGPALGMGMHMALATDFVLSHSDAYLQLPEARHGFPDVLHAALLERLLGRGRQLAISLLGERLSAADAAACGIVYRIYPTCGELDLGVKQLTDSLLKVPAEVRRLVKKSITQMAGVGDLALQLKAIEMYEAQLP